MNRRTLLRRIGTASAGTVAATGVTAAAVEGERQVIDGEEFLVSADVDLDELSVTAAELRNGTAFDATSQLKSCCPPSECDYTCDICCY